MERVLRMQSQNLKKTTTHNYLECSVLQAVADAREAFSVDSDSIMSDVVLLVPSNDAGSYLATFECAEAFVVG